MVHSVQGTGVTNPCVWIDSAKHHLMKWNFSKLASKAEHQNSKSFATATMLVLLKRVSGNATRVSAAARAFSSTVPDRPVTSKRSLITHQEGVHQTVTTSKAWKNKPLFRRQGDVRFKTGLEAANLLVGEAKRRDDHEHEFIDSIRSTMQCLSPISIGTPSTPLSRNN
jgi:hypothetical protein